MSYATGLRPNSLWLLLQGTIKMDLIFWAAFSPKQTGREEEDHFL